ncbi:MAG: hypothetical protein AB2L14_03590 [Candidatus Xenobiia bacterium LiM19]
MTAAVLFPALSSTLSRQIPEYVYLFESKDVFISSRAFLIEARATEQSRREVVETLMLKCPKAPWHVKLSAPFKVKPCQNVTVSITTHDFNGAPCSIPLVLKGAMIDEHTRDIRGKSVTETRVIKERFNQAVRTDRDGNAEWSFAPGEEGKVRVEAVVRDRQGI